MKKICPNCKQEIEVIGTGIPDKFKFVKHNRWKAYSEDEEEENLHQRNIVDIICEGSETETFTPTNSQNCFKSPNSKHEIVYPRLEASIDTDKKYPEPYCKFCFKTENEME